MYSTVTYAKTASASDTIRYIHYLLDCVAARRPYGVHAMWHEDSTPNDPLGWLVHMEIAPLGITPDQWITVRVRDTGAPFEGSMWSTDHVLLALGLAEVRGRTIGVGPWSRTVWTFRRYVPFPSLIDAVTGPAPLRYLLVAEALLPLLPDTVAVDNLVRAMETLKVAVTLDAAQNV